MPVFVPYAKHKLKKAQNISVADFDDGPIYLMMLKNTHTPNTQLHEFLSDIQADEVAAGTSYSAGGLALSALALTQVGEEIFFDAADASIAQDATGFTDGFYAVIYQSTGNPLTAELIGIATYSASQSIQDGALNFAWNASGVMKWA